MDLMSQKETKPIEIEISTNLRTHEDGDSPNADKQTSRSRTRGESETSTGRWLLRRKPSEKNSERQEKATGNKISSLFKKIKRLGVRDTTRLKTSVLINNMKTPNKTRPGTSTMSVMFGAVGTKKGVEEREESVVDTKLPELYTQLPPEAPQVSTDQESWDSSKKTNQVGCSE
jgi:hypothetical protein